MEERGNDVTATFPPRNRRPAYASAVAPGMTATAIGHMLKKIFAASDALRRHADSRRRHWRLGGLRKYRNDSPPAINTRVAVNTDIKILFTMAF